MMRRKKLLRSMFVLLLGLGGLHAQEAVTAVGGEAIGSGGTASYTVGQVAYTIAAGSNGKVSQGVQQPFEIFVVGIYDLPVDVDLYAYPNPTSDYLILEVDSVNLLNLNIQLIDMRGIVLLNQEVNHLVTQVDMKNLPNGIYFLNVNDYNKIVKTFKVIKQ